VIGVFGGTFDPPHLGHAEAIQGVLDEMSGTAGLKKIWILPSGSPVSKTPSLTARMRLELARLAFEGLEDTEVVDSEVVWSEQHPGQTSTTWKLLPVLEHRAQGERLAWIIGTDQLNALHRWDRFPEVLERLNWIVLERAGSDPTGVTLRQWQDSGLLKASSQLRSRSGCTGYLTRTGTSLIVVPTPAREVSSTQIREHWARTGEFLAGTLDPKTEARLKALTQYGSHRTKL